MIRSRSGWCWSPGHHRLCLSSGLSADANITVVEQPLSPRPLPPPPPRRRYLQSRRVNILQQGTWNVHSAAQHDATCRCPSCACTGANTGHDPSSSLPQDSAKRVPWAPTHQSESMPKQSFVVVRCVHAWICMPHATSVRRQEMPCPTSSPPCLAIRTGRQPRHPAAPY